MHENDMKVIDNAKNGNKDAMTKLIEDNNGLIWSIVRRFNGRGYDIEDLYQIGTIGFIKAIQRFDTSFEVRLSTYAVPYILGEIKRYIRDDGPIKVSRSIKELNVKILELQREFLHKYGRDISLEEISKELKISKEEIAMALDSARPVDSIEDAKYKDNKTDKTVSILEQISTGKDEETEITNRITIKNLINELKSLPININSIINKEVYKEITNDIYKENDIFFIGRNVDYALCMEGSLKLKEISYIHSEAYAAGELKHGTISLIDNNTPVFAIVTKDSIKEKTISNIKEVKSRGAKVILVTNDINIDKEIYDVLIEIPKTSDLLQSMLTIVPLQVLSYEIAKLRGCDIDKPKNLAKSVTVE